MRYCKRCIYHENIPAITFDAEGICNYCRQYDEMDKQYPVGKEGERYLLEFAEKAKREGKGKDYDIIVGVSGGCDSSFMLHLAKDLGLRPLATHFDNTWNSTIAVENIKVMTERLNIDLFTHVADNHEYNDIFRSLLMASVPEIDAVADLALATTHYMAAEKFKVKYIWQGHSFRTEGISPPGWFYMDARYISSIHKQFGSGKNKTVPLLWMTKWFKWMLINKIQMFRPIYYIDFKKEQTKQFLADTYGWQWYGGHHMENRTAYFTNNYYLPKKFGIDLRWCEFSAYVRSGQKTREQALDEIQSEKPFDPLILEEVHTRLKFSQEEFENVMALPKKSYKDYPTYKQTFVRMKPVFWALYKAGYVTRSFYDKFTAKN
jgi:N-acetyl sugar amidotransferase